MFSTLVVVLAVLAGFEAQLVPGKTCQDEIRPGLTVEALCRRTEHKQCQYSPDGLICACEIGYEEEHGTCRAQVCSDKIEETDISWSELCDIPYANTDCLAEPNIPPQCGCKNGFKKDVFGKCVAISCDEIKKGQSLTWRQECQMENMRCLDDKNQGPICIVSSCDEIKPGRTQTFKEICEGQKSNLVCVEIPYGEPGCQCKEGFKNVSNSCTVKSCADVYKDRLSWKDVCENLVSPFGMECISSGQEGPRCACNNKYHKGHEEISCLPKTCNDMRTGGRAWKSYCETYNHKECRSDVVLGPDCYCKQGYKPDGDVCKEQKCTDWFNVTTIWKNYCDEVDNRICVENPGRIPMCICKKNYKENSTSCIPSKCTDQVPGETLTYEQKCMAQKCVDSPKYGPMCVVKTCKDLKTGSLSYEEFCATKSHMYCVEVLQGIPKCECGNGFKLESEPFQCVPKNCYEEREPRVRWRDFCERDPTKSCFDHHVNGPQCLCKDGFRMNTKGQCEQIYCPSLNITPNTSPGRNCSRVKAGDSCEMSCIQGYDPVPTTHTCDMFGKWNNNMPSCIKIVKETLCQELVAPGNGTVQGKCKNARPKSQCTFNCNPGFQMMSVVENSNILICTKSGQWSPLVEPVCIDKCALEDNILMCHQDNAVCMNTYSGADVTCKCTSPYLVWKIGKGCQYKKYGYVATMKGLKIELPEPFSTLRKMTDSGHSRSDAVQIIAYLEAFVVFSKMSGYSRFFEGERILSLTPQGNSGLWTAEFLLFFSQPQFPDILEIYYQEKYRCPRLDENGTCTFHKGVTIRKQDFQRTEVKKAEPACKSEYHGCPVGSSCVQDPDSPMSFTCECDKGFTTAHKTFHQDPRTFRTVVCVKKNAGDEVLKCSQLAPPVKALEANMTWNEYCKTLQRECTEPRHGQVLTGCGPCISGFQERPELPGKPGEACIARTGCTEPYDLSLAEGPTWIQHCAEQNKECTTKFGLNCGKCLPGFRPGRLPSDPCVSDRDTNAIISRLRTILLKPGLVFVHEEESFSYSQLSNK